MINQTADDDKKLVSSKSQVGELTASDDGASDSHHHHHHHRRMNKTTRVVLIVLGVIGVVVASAVVALAVAINKGKASLHLEGSIDVDLVPETVEVIEEDNTVTYKGHTYKYNENVIAVLLIGRDLATEYNTTTDATCADANVLFTIDTSTNVVKAIEIPRNSMVDVDLYKNGIYTTTEEMQLALAHAAYTDSLAGSAANTVTSSRRIFYGLPIEKYIDIDEKAFVDAATAIGGVSVEALDSIPGTDIVKCETVLLLGEAAYSYVQYRDVDKEESALDRQERQMQFIQAFVNKASKKDVSTLMKIYSSVSDYIETNITLSEVMYLTTCFATGDNATFELRTISGTTETVEEADGIEREHYFLDEDSTIEATLAAFYTQID